MLAAAQLVTRRCGIRITFDGRDKLSIDRQYFGDEECVEEKMLCEEEETEEDGDGEDEKRSIQARSSMRGRSRGSAPHFCVTVLVLYHRTGIKRSRSTVQSIKQCLKRLKNWNVHPMIWLENIK